MYSSKLSSVQKMKTEELFKSKEITLDPVQEKKRAAIKNTIGKLTKLEHRMKNAVWMINFLNVIAVLWIHRKCLIFRKYTLKTLKNKVTTTYISYSWMGWEKVCINVCLYKFTYTCIRIQANVELLETGESGWKMYRSSSYYSLSLSAENISKKSFSYI